ncbi:MAG TPA: type II toxin-antitoxin system RelE/ParE family toxin [Draconibacterium sp.]|nr:type II toxin-antitoxin system RelE/ParE family toxin [Draconibacterium sp.]
MKIFWTDFASETLSEIYQYYKENASPIIAKKIKSEIFNSTRQLKEFPHSGHFELNLRRLNQGHRYLVRGNYKIIYKEIPDGILITDVFDTRQDPVKINKPGRKSGRKEN